MPLLCLFLCVGCYYSTSTAATKTSPQRTAIDRTISSNIGSLPVERVTGGKPHTHIHRDTHIHPTHTRVLACAHTVATTLTQRRAHTHTHPTYTHVCLHVCAHTHTHTHTHTESHTHTHTEMHAHTHNEESWQPLFGKMNFCICLH